MTSKEALIKLVDKTGIINDTCASLEDCIKCGKCRWDDECVENCDDYKLVMTIKQDLERLKTLEEENEYLKNANEEYQQGNYDLSMIYAKFKQALDILKRFNFMIFSIKDNNNELAFRIYTDSLLEIQPLNKEEYELLKEVFGNDK